MIPPKLPTNFDKAGTYEVLEDSNGRFYPGMWIFRIKKLRGRIWFRSEHSVDFEYLTMTGQPSGNYCGDRPMPPLAGPYSTLDAARKFIQGHKSKSKSSSGPIKYHKA